MDMDRLSKTSYQPDAASIGPGYALSDPRAADLFTSPLPSTQQPVTEMNALNISAVWAATRVITSATSVLPMDLYKEGVSSGVKKKVDTPKHAYDLTVKPCPEMTYLNFWEFAVQHALIWGNSYAEIERNYKGEAVALWPLLPNCVRPFRDEKTQKIYYLAGYADKTVVLPQKDVFHLSGMGFDGIMGYSVVGMARRSMRLTSAGEFAGDAYFSNGMRPSGWVEDPRSFTEIQRDNTLEEMKNRYGGAGKFGQGMLLWGGMKYHPVPMSNIDSQFLETRQFQTEEIARWFNVPPHKIKDLKRSTFSNIESQNREFYTDCLLYWLTKICQEFKAKILDSIGRQYSVCHDPEVLLSGDTIARYTGYGLGRQWGILSVNECRAKERLAPIEGGDIHHIAVNMTRLGNESNPNQNVDKPKQEDGTQPGKDGKPTSPTGKAIAIDAARAICQRDCGEVIATASDDSFSVWASRCDAQDWEWTAAIVGPAIAAIRANGDTTVDAHAFVAAYAERRGGQLRAIASDEKIHVSATLLADSWTRDDEIEAVANLILGTDAV